MPVMLAFLTITSLLVMLQAYEFANLRASGRLIEAQREAMALRSLHARLTGDIAKAMVDEGGRGLPLGGAFVERDVNGQVWQVSAQDVEGLVDLYLAPPDVLRRAGLNERQILAARDRLSAEARFGRLPTLEQTAAYMAIPREHWHMLTQSARAPGLRPETLPEALSALGRGLPDPMKVFVQVTHARITFQRAPAQAER